MNFRSLAREMRSTKSRSDGLALIARTGGSVLLTLAMCFGLVTLSPQTARADTTGSISGAVVFDGLCANESVWSGTVVWRIDGGTPSMQTNSSYMSGVGGQTPFDFAGLPAGEYRVTVHTANPGVTTARYLGQVFGGASLAKHSFEMTDAEILAGTPLVVTDGALPAIEVHLSPNPNAASPGNICGGGGDTIAPTTTDDVPSAAVSGPVAGTAPGLVDTRG